jgi:exopolyphosphatase/pppGpp-phosphohydrolase
MNEAAKADRAEKQAIAKFGFESEEAKMNRDQKERLGQAELEVRREANRLTKDFNTARIGALTTGKTTKAMAELIQKENAPINKRLATLLMGKDKSKAVQDMIKTLQAEKLANENKIRAYFAQEGLAGTQTSASNTADWGDLQVN